MHGGLRKNGEVSNTNHPPLGNLGKTGPSETARVMIVDDEVELAQMFKKLLNMQWDGYDISIAASGAEALRVIQKEKFDVLVTDVKMPEMNGVELIKRAKNTRGNPETIVVSGHGVLENAIEALHLGAYNYLRKPVSAEVLHFAVKNAWEKKKNDVLRRKTEADLRESQARYKAMFENMNDGVAVCQALNNGEDFIFVDFNKAGEKIDHILKEDLLGKSVLEICPSIREFGLFDVLRHVWATGKPQFHPVGLYADARIRGWRRHYVYKLSDDTVVDIFSDETDRKRSEEALRESEKRYRTLFDNAGDAIFVHDWGKIFLDVNKVACERLGFSREELLGMAPKDILDTESAATLPDDIESLKKHGSIVFESVHVTKDGLMLPFEGSAKVIEFEGEPAILTISRDISERKKSEEEQNKLRDQLHHAQKMESIGTLAGGIAHDFNNILYPIIGYAQMAFDDLPEESTVRPFVKSILDSSYRARDLVQHILAFSRQSKQERVPVRLQYLVKEVMKLLRATIPTTITVHGNIERCGAVLADSGQIHQVIMNLCTNAFHSMAEKGGKLEISLNETDIGPEQYADIRPGRYLRLTVADTGHGMTPEIANRIFDPYFTTKQKGKGTGLGLSVTHGIVKGHNGHVKVSSEPGKGATFHVFLPLMEEETHENANKSESVPDIPTGGERILFVDDEPQIVDMTTTMLKRLGYQVTALTGSLDALDLFRKNPDDFDLIITDATMPDMTGVELSKEMLRIRPDIPIILCTGFSETITKETALQAGIPEFVTKPLLKTGIARVIRKVLTVIR